MTTEKIDCVLCKECVFWNPNDIEVSLEGWGRCCHADSWGTEPMYAWDSEANDPHLLTVSGHGCMAGKKKL